MKLRAAMLAVVLAVPADLSRPRVGAVCKQRLPWLGAALRTAARSNRRGPVKSPSLRRAVQPSEPLRSGGLRAAFHSIQHISMINTNAQIVAVCLRSSSRFAATIRALRYRAPTCRPHEADHRPRRHSIYCRICQARLSDSREPRRLGRAIGSDL